MRKVVIAALLVLVVLIAMVEAGPPCLCPSGTERMAKYEWKDGAWVYEAEEGNQDVYQIEGDARSGTWWGPETEAMIVKGGGNCYTEMLNGVASGTYNADSVGGKDVSFLQFCREGGATAIRASYFGARGTGRQETWGIFAGVVAVMVVLFFVPWMLGRRKRNG